MQMTGIQSSDMGLVQAIADNFDANITSPNGLKSTHVLAPLMTQVCPNTEDCQEALQSKDSGRKILKILLDLVYQSATTVVQKSLKFQKKC